MNLKKTAEQIASVVNNWPQWKQQTYISKPKIQGNKMKTTVKVPVNIPNGLFTYDLGGETLHCHGCNGFFQLDIAAYGNHSEGIKPVTDFELIFSQFIEKHQKCLGITTPTDTPWMPSDR